MTVEAGHRFTGFPLRGRERGDSRFWEVHPKISLWVQQGQSGVQAQIPAWAGRGRQSPAFALMEQLSSLKSELNHLFLAGSALAEVQTPGLKEGFS